MAERRRDGGPASAADEPADDLSSFEADYEALEAVVDKLEHEDLKLSEALATYEQGVALLGRCRRKLEVAEQRLEKLIAKADGTVGTVPIDPSQLGPANRGSISAQASEAEA